MDGTHRIDHLSGVKEGYDEKWVRPYKADIQYVYDEQIIPVNKISGEWEYFGRKPVYILSNMFEIAESFLNKFCRHVHCRIYYSMLFL